MAQRLLSKYTRLVSHLSNVREQQDRFGNWRRCPFRAGGKVRGGSFFISVEGKVSEV